MDFLLLEIDQVVTKQFQVARVLLFNCGVDRHSLANAIAVVRDILAKCSTLWVKEALEEEHLLVKLDKRRLNIVQIILTVDVLAENPVFFLQLVVEESKGLEV